MSDKTDKKQNKPHLFQPGQSGNPKGRPKGSTSLNELLKRIGAEDLPGTDWDKREAIMRKVYKLAFEGKPWAVQFIADRTEGKPAQTVIQKDSNKPDFSEVEFVRFKQ